MPIGEEIGFPLSEREVERPKREERPRSKWRGKALPWESEMGLSGKFTRRNMMQSSLGNTKEVRRAVLENPKQQEDAKLYGQLPDYDDFQGYDLGKEDILRQIPLVIYDNFHMPSWETLKHHLFMIKSQKNI